MRIKIVQISCLQVKATFDFVLQLLGQGNYVVSYGQTQIGGVAYDQCDIFHLENRKIVEHWDNKEVMPKVEDLTN